EIDYAIHPRTKVRSSTQPLHRLSEQDFWLETLNCNMQLKERSFLFVLFTYPLTRIVELDSSGINGDNLLFLRRKQFKSNVELCYSSLDLRITWNDGDRNPLFQGLQEALFLTVAKMKNLLQTI
ncbi:hypothetical protein J4421_05175, partial [Candidatus Woesearchaeota archaeon]|nr:hypothetical protein [Candidatus Woesearchaeota archaeon]